MLQPTLYLNDELTTNLIEFVSLKENIQYLSVEGRKGQRLKLVYLVPILDLQFMWYPSSDGVVFLNNEWDKGVTTRLNQSLPLICLMNQNNHSLFSIAVNELINEVELTVGVHEESASAKVTIETIIPKENYEIKLSIFDKKRQWTEVVERQVKWLYQESDSRLPRVPSTSFEPVLSTWYSFHQQVTASEVFEESIAYKNLGAKTLILDDGWQTIDNSRRYAYAGDWEVSLDKFPDFSQHIKKVQELDMSYLVWLSLPYIGEKSQNWELFKEDLLYVDDFQRAGILDIRKEKVQNYLAETVKKFIDAYPINGLKIDFLETFFSEKIDSYEIGEGLLAFLEKLKLILEDRADFLIEYRQDYINPLMMQYCQIVRSKDCPNNYVLNRIRTIDLRLSCPFTAVHSDMIMWNNEERIEDAALHLINTIFSVPQLSMRYDELSKEEIEMIMFWFSFIKEHQDLLLKSTFEPLYPQEGYSVVRVGQENKSLVGIFGEDKIVDSTEEVSKQRLFVNGTKTDKLYITLPKGTYHLAAKTCLGHVSTSKKIILSETQLLAYHVPKSGVLIIDTE